MISGESGAVTLGLLYHVLHGADDIARIDPLAGFVVRGRDGDDVKIRLLIGRRKLDAAGDGALEQLRQALLLKGELPRLQLFHDGGVVVRPDDLVAVGREHQRGRQADISQSDHIYHNTFAPFFRGIAAPVILPCDPA